MRLQNFDREKYEQILSRGLCDGERDGERMCIMAALNASCGAPISDSAESPCVSRVVRTAAIRLNDGPWSSAEARAKGLHDLGIAILDTQDIDEEKFARSLVLKTIKKIFPIALREVGLDSHAVACERAADLAEGKKAAWAAEVAAEAAKAAVEAAAAAEAVAMAAAEVVAVAAETRVTLAAAVAARVARTAAAAKALSAWVAAQEAKEEALLTLSEAEEAEARAAALLAAAAAAAMAGDAILCLFATLIIESIAEARS